MHKLFLAVVLATATALGGCAGLTQANLSANVAAFEASVQSDANLVCGFIPTVATIASLIPVAGTVAPEAASVAEAICAAIAAAPAPAVQSARLRSLGTNVPATVGTLVVSGVGVAPIRVPIVGTYTR